MLATDTPGGAPPDRQRPDDAEVAVEGDVGDVCVPTWTGFGDDAAFVSPAGFEDVGGWAGSVS